MRCFGIAPCFTIVNKFGYARLLSHENVNIEQALGLVETNHNKYHVAGAIITSSTQVYEMTSWLPFTVLGYNA